MKIWVWISGGVDSAVAAYILKQQWHTIVWIFMLNYLDENNPNCSTKNDLESFYEVCKFLDIPYEVLDFRKEYEEKILHYIYQWYLAGITPNPDILCNTEVKFKLFLNEVLSMGYDAIATGHYAKILQRNKNYELRRATDLHKDQSYFLAWLDQFQLSHALFPLGDLYKSQVRELAKQIGLPNAERKDSQWLCFVGNIAMADFLKEKIGEKKGNIILQDGTIIGTHSGAYQFTIGQRKWLWLHIQCYVCWIDVEHNTVTVTQDKESDMLGRSHFGIHALHRIGTKPAIPWDYFVKCRYRQEPQPCTLIQHNWRYECITESKQIWVPNGQIAVFYTSDTADSQVIWCGEICS